MKTNPAAVIELLAQNESLISDLYLLYAQRLPVLADFWHYLAKEEQQHASWLRNTLKAVDDKSIALADRFSPAAITTFKTYMSKEITAAKNHVLTEKQALTTALYLENSLIEKDCFTIFKSADKEFSEMLAKQTAETQSHIGHIQQMMKVKGLKSFGLNSETPPHPIPAASMKV